MTTSARTAGRVSAGPWEVSVIGRQLYRLRTGREPRLTQQQLAERAGVSLDLIQKLEQGRKREARLSTLAKIAEALEVELAGLVSEPRAAAGREAPAPEDSVPVATGRGARHKPRRNDLLRRARLAILSPSGSGDPISRQELAEAVNAYLHSVGVMSFLDGHDIGRYERGETRWPRAHHRRAFRAVLGAATDAQLGLFSTRPSPSNAEPFESEEPGGLDEPADDRVGGTALDAPVPQTPVVVHWTGRKACALRVAMRMSIHDFAAKLGVSLTTVRGWQEDSTGRLRFETYQLLDTMLSIATEDDARRFDLALREFGETQRS